MKTSTCIYVALAIVAMLAVSCIAPGVESEVDSAFAEPMPAWRVMLMIAACLAGFALALRKTSENRPSKRPCRHANPENVWQSLVYQP